MEVHKTDTSRTPLKRCLDSGHSEASQASSEETDPPSQTLKRAKKSNMACNRTAVAVLQELCMKRKWNPPLYETEDVSGPSNDPMFVVSVTLCNGIKGIGRGKQKKAAKHDAAQKALDLLQERALPDSSSNNTAPVQRAAVNPHQDIGGNPVGELQNLCSQKHFPSPDYVLTGDEGEPHEKIFTYKCTVMQRTATGRACKKQVAKHLAAQNMLQLLNSNLKQILDDIPNDPAVTTSFSQRGKKDSFVTDLDKKKDIVIAERYKAIRDMRDDIPSAPTISPGTKFSDYHTAFLPQLEGLGDLLDKPVIKCEEDRLKKLKMVAESLNFKVSITEDTGRDDWYIVFVQVDTNPPTIQAGRSPNLNTATQEAAGRILDFLKVMSK